jgi:hypothetical protein
MKLDLNVPITDLDGKPIEGQTLGKIAASLFAQKTDGDSLKLYGWALKLNAGETLDLDASDEITFRESVKSFSNATALLKAQIFQAMK